MVMNQILIELLSKLQ